MLCQIYKKQNCIGCPEIDKDYCEGVKLSNKTARHNEHKYKYYTTYRAIMPFIIKSKKAELTSTDILNRINEASGKKFRTNLFYVNEVMKNNFEYKKINGKIHYFAKIVEPCY